MKHVLAFTLFCACAIGAGCGPGTRPVDEGASPLRLGVNLETPPYQYRNEQGEIVGTEIDMAKAIAAKMGRKLDIHVMPFEELIPRLHAGELDLGIAMITVTSARRRDVDFSDSYDSQGCCFLYRTGATVPTMITSFQLLVGTVNATTPDIYLSLHNLNPRRFRTGEDAIEALETGKIDAVFYDAVPLRHAAAKSGGKLSVTPLETRENYAIAVRKGQPRLLAVCNEVVREVLKK